MYTDEIIIHIGDASTSRILLLPITVSSAMYSSSIHITVA